MRKHIFMNDKIRMARPDGPVINVQSAKRIRRGNRVDIVHQGVVVASVIYAPRRNPSRTHAVRAWVETDCVVRVS